MLPLSLFLFIAGPALTAPFPLPQLPSIDLPEFVIYCPSMSYLEDPSAHKMQVDFPLIELMQLMVPDANNPCDASSGIMPPDDTMEDIFNPGQPLWRLTRS